MGDKDKNSNTNSNDLWARAAQGGPISREELGISNSNSSKGLTSLNEGTQKWTFDLDKDKKND